MSVYENGEGSGARARYATFRQDEMLSMRNPNPMSGAFVQLPPKLCEFVGVPVQTILPLLVANKLVGHVVIKYIRDNRLFDNNDKRRIRGDAKLLELLDATKNDMVTYFNIMRFLIRPATIINGR